MERQRQAWPPEEGAERVEALAAPDVLAPALMSASAPGADGAARQQLVDRLSRLDLGDARATADRLEALLSSGELASLRGRDGRSVRAVAVDRLLQLGYPFALEVTPEDLAHWRAERPTDSSDGRGLAVLLVSVSACISLWGLAEPARGVGVALVLALEAVAVAAAIRPGMLGWARRVLFGLGVAACVLGLHFGLATLLPGVAGLVAARLLATRAVRGVD